MSSNKKTILVIEDDEKHKKFFRTALESANYRVLEAENGVDALNILHEEAHNIDLITLDYQMPKMDGAEFLRKIQEDKQIKILRDKNGKKNDIPVILITVFITLYDVKEMRKSVVDFLPKPLSYKDIIRAVNRLLK